MALRLVLHRTFDSFEAASLLAICGTRTFTAFEENASFTTNAAAQQSTVQQLLSFKCAHHGTHTHTHTHTHTPPITCTAPTRVAKRRGYLWAALLIPSSGGAALAQPGSAARAPRGLQEVASAHTAPAYKFKMEGSVDGLKAKAAGDSCHHTDTDTHTQAQRHA